MALIAERLGVLLLAVLAALGCSCSDGGSKRTQIMVVANTDLLVPAEIDGLEVSATNPTGKKVVARATFRRPSDLPGTVGILYPGGALGPFRVVMVAKRGDAEVVTREAEFTFVKGATLTLAMSLLRSCVNVGCLIDQTCTERGCASKVVPRIALTPWKPADGGRDTAVGSDAGDAQVTCVPRRETCNQADDDCDGRIDEDFDQENDPLNCGKCGKRCSLRNADSACSFGRCVIGQCQGYSGDCDEDDSTGCETDLNSTDTCGSCSVRCRGEEQCCRGLCQLTCS